MMRIIAGRHRGRRLVTREGLGTRPTAARAREGLFDILTHRPPGLDGAHVVDLFAGSGALGLEAVSRGAASAVLVERDRAAASAIRQNIQALGEASTATLLAADATRLQRSKRAHDLVLIEPPWGVDVLEPVLRGLDQGCWLKPEGLVVLEHRIRAGLVPTTGFTIVDERHYGKTSFLLMVQDRGSARAGA